MLVARAGMNPMRWLKLTDDNERLIQFAVAHQFEERRQKDQTNLAIEIANQVGKSFGG